VNAWDVTRAQAGDTRNHVDYSGGSVAGGYNPTTPYSNAAGNPQVTAYAKSFLKQLEHVFPGITPQWNGRATLSTPSRDPLLNARTRTGSPVNTRSSRATKASRREKIHFAGEHCSQDFQGFMEGGATEGIRAAKEVFAAL